VGARARGERMTAWAWRGIGMLLYVAVVFGPLVALLFVSIRSTVLGDVGVAALVVPTGRRLHLLWNSLVYAGAVATGGMLLGTLAALRLWRVKPGLWSSARWLVVALAAIPPYMHALAWTTAVSSVSSVLAPGGGSGAMLQGWVGAWWVQTMALLPLAVGLALIGLESIDPKLLEAGRMQRGDLRVLTAVGIPLAMPMLMAGAGLLFILTLLDYSVPALFYVNVYSLDVFAEFSATGRPERAFLAALPLVVPAAIVVFLSQRIVRRVAQRPSWNVSSWSTPPVWPRWLRFVEAAGLGVLGVQSAVLFTALVVATDSFGAFAAGVSGGGRELLFSGVTALSAAVLSIPLAVIAAEGSAAGGLRQRFWWALIMLPLAVPAPLVGMGLVSVWNRVLPVDVYGTVAMPVLAALPRFAPFAALVVMAQLRRIHPRFLEAAILLRPEPFAVRTRIWLPMVAPGLVAAAAVCFSLTMGELGATLIVAPPGRATVTMRVYNLLHYGAGDQVAGLCLMLAAVTLAAAALAAATIAFYGRGVSRGG